MQLARFRGFCYALHTILKPIIPVSYNIISHQRSLTWQNRRTAGLLLFSFSLFPFKSKKDELSEEEKIEEEKKRVIARADELYKQNKYKDVRELLEEYRESSEVELLWRLSRVLYNMSQEIATTPEEKKHLIFEAFDVISRSLALDETNYANHKWMSILLDARTAYDGIKARISHLDSVKNHMLVFPNS